MLKKLIPLVVFLGLIASSGACVNPDPYKIDEPDSGKNEGKGREGKETGDTVVAVKLPVDFLSAKENVACMGAGWNLGNTLDAHSGDTTNMWIECWGPHGITEYETAWGQATPTPELFKMLREAGFRSIRIPVTWYY